MEKKLKTDTIPFDMEILSTSLEEASRLILEEKNKLEKKGYQNIRFEIDYNYSSTQLDILADRHETDEEYKLRLMDEAYLKKLLEKKENKEKSIYEKLKRKYG